MTDDEHDVSPEIHVRDFVGKLQALCEEYGLTIMGGDDFGEGLWIYDDKLVTDKRSLRPVFNCGIIDENGVRGGSWGEPRWVEK